MILEIQPQDIERPHGYLLTKAAKTKKPLATKYDEKVALKRSFIDLIQAAMKDAKKKYA